MENQDQSTTEEQPKAMTQDDQVTGQAPEGAEIPEVVPGEGKDTGEDPEPEPEKHPDGKPEQPEALDPIAVFDAQYPAFGPWFDRVQKWAQFNSRPTPEPNEAYHAAFAAKTAPDQAAANHCLPQL